MRYSPVLLCIARAALVNEVKNPGPKDQVFSDEIKPQVSIMKKIIRKKQIDLKRSNPWSQKRL
jgi:hypothetical protein